MKKIFFCSIFLFLFLGLLRAESLPVAPYLPATTDKEAQNAPITVQYPQEKMAVPHGATSVYLFGKINLQAASLQINGVDVPLHINGTFLAYLPVKQGEFTFLLTAQSQGKTYQATRSIVVPGTPIEEFEESAKFDPKEIFPSKPLWLLPGDTMLLSARGTPNAKVQARLVGIKNAQSIELTEQPKQRGLYQARYTIPTDQKTRSVKIIYSMVDEKTQTKDKITAEEKLKILNPHSPLQPARVKSAGTKLRKIPVSQGSLYPFYRAFGEVLISGRANGLYRLRLANGESAWIEERKVKLFSAGQYRPNVIDELDVLSSPDSTQVRWGLEKQVPLFIEEFKDRLEVSFYYTPVFEQNFNLDTTSALVDRVEWQRSQTDIIKFILYFKPEQPLWGYAYHYEKNDFVLNLHQKPTLATTPQKPLLGARILIDAGHSPKRTNPYDGLVTPSGFLEYELNLDLAETLKPKLEQAGATVIMTRSGHNHIGLTQRYKKALNEKAHIFVSLHYNALPDTVNPLAMPRGYSVYYAYPHSFDLAESIYKSFNKRVPLADNGLINDDILFIPRISDIPSVLVENAFPILPEQEDWVLSQTGRETLAETLYQGIVDFYKNKYPAQ